MQFTQIAILAISEHFHPPFYKWIVLLTSHSATFSLNVAAAPKAQLIDLTSVFGTVEQGGACDSAVDCIGLGTSCCEKNDGTGLICAQLGAPDVTCNAFLQKKRF